MKSDQFEDVIAINAKKTKNKKKDFEKVKFNHIT
jgi:hypothetical protein